MNPAYPSAGRAWYVTILLTVAYVLSFIDKYIPALLTELIKTDLALTDTQMGLLLGPAFAVLYALIGLPLGFWADFTRRTGLVAAGAALWSMATAASGLAQTFSHLLLARVFVGIGDAALAPCALSLIADSFPPARRGRPVAFYVGAQSVGAGLALLGGFAVLEWVQARPPVSLPMIGQLAPWQLTFLGVGLPGLAVALLLALAPEPARQTPPTSHVSVSASRDFLRSRWALFTAFFALVCVMTIIAYSQNWYPAVFQRTWGWSLGRFAIATGLALVILGPLTVNATGWLADKLAARGRATGALDLVFAGTALLVPTGIAAPLMPSGETAFAIWLLNLIGLSTVSAAAPIALLAVVPGQFRGQMSALFYMVIMLIGLVVGPLAVGVCTDTLFDESGIRYSAALVALLTGLPALPLAMATRRLYRRAL